MWRKVVGLESDMKVNWTLEVGQVGGKGRVTLRPPGSLACGGVWGMDRFGEGVRSLAVGVSHGSHQEQCHKQEDESVVLGAEVWACRRGWLKDRLKG